MPIAILLPPALNGGAPGGCRHPTCLTSSAAHFRVRAGLLVGRYLHTILGPYIAAADLFISLRRWIKLKNGETLVMR